MLSCFLAIPAPRLLFTPFSCCLSQTVSAWLAAYAPAKGRLTRRCSEHKHLRRIALSQATLDRLSRLLHNVQRAERSLLLAVCALRFIVSAGASQSPEQYLQICRKLQNPQRARLSVMPSVMAAALTSRGIMFFGGSSPSVLLTEAVSCCSSVGMPSPETASAS